MNKVENLITENIDLWTSSIKTKASTGRGSSKKIDLHGIKKMRELILELAVRGKLVPQDPSDEPATALLKRIAEEKAQLVADKKIKKTKKLPEITDEEKPFDLPKGWKWERVGSITSASTGFAFKSSQYVDQGQFVLRVTNINPDSTINTDDSKYIDPSVSKLEAEKFALSEYDVLLVMVGGSLGKLGVVSNEVLPAVLNQNMWKLARYGSMPLGYFLNGLRYVNRNQVEITASTHGHLSQGDYLNKLFPVPPLEEQHRIVAKVDELMALCDQLEQQSEASIDAHQQLATTLLDSLLSISAEGSAASSNKELTDNWQRVEDNFDLLITDNIQGQRALDQLKQTILQLAVMGKLVPQDPTDEPASALLERIAEEKAQLIKDKKIKKQKPLPPISDDEKPFELPVGWECCRFGLLGYDLGGGTPTKSNSDYWNGNIPWVSPKDMKVDKIASAQDSITELAVEKSTVKLIPVGSLLMVVRGMILAHSFPVAITEVPVVINQDMKALVFSEVDSDFMLLMLKGIKSDVVNMVERSSHGTCKLVSDTLWRKVVAIPPLEEQKRIVAKVDQLMTLCDQLKDRLTTAQQTQNHLADALVDQALS